MSSSSFQLSMVLLNGFDLGSLPHREWGPGGRTQRSKRRSPSQFTSAEVRTGVGIHWASGQSARPCSHFTGHSGACGKRRSLGAGKHRKRLLQLALPPRPLSFSVSLSLSRGISSALSPVLAHQRSRRPGVQPSAPPLPSPPRLPPQIPPFHPSVL